MITTKDIAAICQVSRGTVDRAINGRGRISEETKQQILAVCKKYNYKPDIIARALVTNQTYTLGVVVFDLLNRYFAQIINSAEQEAQQLSYGLNVMLSHTNIDMENKALERLLSYRVDGLLIQPINFGPGLEETLLNMNIPVVAIGNRISERFSFVGIDDFKAAADGAMALLPSRYDKVIFACPPLKYEGITNVSVQRLRCDGFTHVMEGAGRQYEVWIDSITGRLDALLESGKTAAIFCSSDRYVLRFIDHANQHGYRIPEQVGLLGFDNVDILSYIKPVISSIDTPLDQIGADSVQLLYDLIRSYEKPHNIILPHRIIHGESILF